MATPNSTIAAVLNWLKKKAETSSPLDSYPIGAVYISTQPTDPASILGGGWKALNEGRVLIGANTTYPAGSKGGEASVVLSVDQMPGHSHSGSTSAAGQHLHNIYGTANETDKWAYVPAYIDTQHKLLTTSGKSLGTTAYGGNHYHSLDVDSTGGNQPHNNLPPYLSVYMWERIS